MASSPLGSVNNQVYISLNIIMSFIGSMASITTIFIIHRLKSKTGHVQLVLTMSYFQLLYDMTFFFSNVDCGYYISVAANVFQLSCGIAGSLISNWIAFIAWYVVTYRKKLDIFYWYRYMLLSSLLPGIADALIYCVATIPQPNTNDDMADMSVLGMYYYTRLVSIGLNFIMCSIAVYKIRLMGSNKAKKSDHEIAIATVTSRMVLYPIVQAIGRSGYSWYEAAYGSDIDSTDDGTQAQYACLLFLTIITPMVSVGYLIIFLTMQPNAYEHLKSLFTGRPPIERAISRPSSMLARSEKSMGPDDAYNNYTSECETELETARMDNPSEGNTNDWTRPSSFWMGAIPNPWHRRQDEDLMNIIDQEGGQEEGRQDRDDRPAYAAQPKGPGIEMESPKPAPKTVLPKEDIERAKEEVEEATTNALHPGAGDSTA